jgi:hypothetical protein
MWVFINVGAKTLEAMGAVVLGSGMEDNEKREREGCNMLWGCMIRVLELPYLIVDLNWSMMGNFII